MSSLVDGEALSRFETTVALSISRDSKPSTSEKMPTARNSERHMSNTPFSAKTLDPAHRDPETNKRRRDPMTRRPWLIRCSYRNAAKLGSTTAHQQPERNSLNDYAAEILRSRKRVGALLMSWGLLVFVGLTRSAYSATPEETLRAYGLQRVEKTWVVPAEMELHDRLEDLGKLERRLQDSKRECDTQIAAIEQLRAQLKTAEETKARLATVLKTSPAGQLRTMLERDQKEQTQLAAKLKEGLPPTDTLGGLAPLKGVLAEQCALRTELALGVIDASRLEAGLAKQYAELASNNDVKNALAELNSQTLGPAKRLTGEQKTLLKYRAAAMAATVPIYREGKRVRVSLILNEELPATLTWHDEHDATLLPYSLAQNLGLTEKLPSKQEQLALPKEKLTLQGWFMTLERIRLGQALAEKTPVFVLAPEHEALGGRLGYEMQKELLLTLDAERLQIKCGTRKSSSDLNNK